MGAAAGLMIVFAKLMITFYVSIAPIMITMSLLNATKDYFQNWLTGIISYAFYPIVIAAVFSVIISMSDQMASNVNSGDLATLGQAIPFFAMIIMAFFRDIPDPRDHAPNHRKYSADICNERTHGRPRHPLRRPHGWTYGPARASAARRPRRGWGNAGAGGQSRDRVGRGNPHGALGTFDREMNMELTPGTFVLIAFAVALVVILAAFISRKGVFAPPV